MSASPSALASSTNAMRRNGRWWPNIISASSARICPKAWRTGRRDVIVVERIDPDGGTAHRISIRGHELIADMSAPDGHDAGPDPHDLYDSALGACRSEEHTSELQSLMRISYAVFCLKKQNY